MPLYFYEPLRSPCRLCGQGFEVHQRAEEAVLKECDRCGQAVRRRLPEAAAPLKILKPASISDAKKAGFTVLKRTPGGEFEKQ
jgi:putative FmdB family regulatory protein